MSCSFSLIPCTFSCVDALLQCSYTILGLRLFKYCEAYVFKIRMLCCLFSVHLLSEIRKLPVPDLLSCPQRSAAQKHNM